MQIKQKLFYSIPAFILILCVIVPTKAQNTIKPNAYSIFRYPNGQIASEGMMHNGKPDGYWKTYYTTGILKSIGNRKNFLLDSIWVFFSPKGDTTERISYLIGKKNGWYIRYAAYNDTTSFNHIIEKALYVNDLRQGKSFIYYKTGELYKIIPYVKGKRQGQGFEFNRKGLVISLIKFNNDLLYDKEYINRKDEKDQKQGFWKTFYDNYSLKTEAFYKDNQLDGLVKYYNPRKKLIKVEEYKNGKLVQEKSKEADKPIVKKEKYPNGKLKFQGAFKNKKPVGIQRFYKANGRLDSAIEYTENGILSGKGKTDTLGRKNGLWHEYTPDGKPAAKGSYHKGKRQGKWKFYYPNGKIAQKGAYSAGKPTGIWQWYFPDETLRRKEEYIRGYADGTSIEYNQKGEIIAQGQFLEGERDGEWYFKNGDITLKGKYDNGLRDGLWQYLYSDSTLKFEGTYLQEEPDGWHRTYYPSGKIKSEKYYSIGRREKTWRYYSSDGILTTTIVYKNDEAVKVDGKKIK